MERKTKRHWLNEALKALGESGAAALTVEVLTTRLSVTKGSFYYHFKSYADFKEKLLQFYEEESTYHIIRIAEEAGPPEEKLQKLLELTIQSRPQVEVAFRAWALQDGEVRIYQARMDLQRMSYLQKLCQDLGQSETEALVMARLLYTIFVGSQQVIPPIQDEERKQLYRQIQQAVSKPAKFLAAEKE